MKSRRMVLIPGSILIILTIALITATAEAWRQHKLVRQISSKDDHLRIEIAKLNERLHEKRRHMASADNDITQRAEPQIKQIIDQQINTQDEIHMLRKRIAELQQRQSAPSQPDPREALTSWMQNVQERLRARDPEGFERQQIAISERLADLADLTQKRMKLMQKVSIEGLAPEYLENHLALIDRLEFLNQAIRQISDDPSDAISVLPGVLINIRGLDQMLAMQRTIFLEDLAYDIGYEDETAQYFVNAVNDIIEATSMPSSSFFRRERKSEIK